MKKQISWKHALKIWWEIAWRCFLAFWVLGFAIAVFITFPLAKVFSNYRNIIISAGPIFFIIVYFFASIIPIKFALESSLKKEIINMNVNETENTKSS